VPDSLSGRSGQGDWLNSRRNEGQRPGSAVGTATDFTLLMPRPEIAENRLIVRRAGEIAATEWAKRAKSSAKANGLTF
jgi:hypothetical protein